MSVQINVSITQRWRQSAAGGEIRAGRGDKLPAPASISRQTVGSMIGALAATYRKRKWRRD